MTCLLDVSTVLALVWTRHVHHSRAQRALRGKSLAVCPITELGFLRVSSSPPFGATQEQARRMLKAFIEACAPKFLPCDLRALESAPAESANETTDAYLCSLAEKHGMQLATLDAGIKHQAAFLLPP